MGNLVKYGENNGTVRLNPPDYICYVEDFVRETNAPDGSTLLVANGATYATDRYCYAFDGHWIDL